MTIVVVVLLTTAWKLVRQKPIDRCSSFLRQFANEWIVPNHILRQGRLGGRNIVCHLVLVLVLVVVSRSATNSPSIEIFSHAWQSSIPLLQSVFYWRILEAIVQNVHVRFEKEDRKTRNAWSIVLADQRWILPKWSTRSNHCVHTIDSFVFSVLFHWSY